MKRIIMLILPLVLLLCACSPKAPAEVPFGEHSSSNRTVRVKETMDDMMEAFNGSNRKEMFLSLFAKVALEDAKGLKEQADTFFEWIGEKVESYTINDVCSYNSRLVDGNKVTQARYNVTLNCSRGDYGLYVGECREEESDAAQEGILFICVYRAEDWVSNGCFEVRDFQEFYGYERKYRVEGDDEDGVISHGFRDPYGIFMTESTLTKAYCDYINYNFPSLSFVYEEWAED